MYSFIVNRHARDGQSQQHWALAEPHFLKAFPDARTYFPSTAQETTETARQLADANQGAIVSVGGEGTMNRVLQGIMQSKNSTTVSMGVVPFGNVNDYTNNLGMQKTWQHALEVLQQGKVCHVGVVELRTERKIEYALNIADLGFGASTAQRHLSGELNWLKGQFKYHLLAIKSLLSWKNIPATIEIDGEVMDVPFVMVLAGYSPTLGGFKLVPHAHVNDTKMAISIAHGLTRLEILKTIQATKNNGIEESDRVHLIHASRVLLRTETPVVTQVDGEITDAAATTIEMIAHPSRLKFISP